MDTVFVITALISALWIMIPAYLPNSAAALFGGGQPMDMGKNWHDSRRILGDGKTWRGFFGGVLSGIFAGIVLIWARDCSGLLWLPEQTLLSVTLLAAGALLGDMIKSFFKRRLNRNRGDEWLIADQYDLVVGAFLLLVIFDWGWVISNITPLVLLWILIITPVLHRAVNIIGYIMGVKEVPW